MAITNSFRVAKTSKLTYNSGKSTETKVTGLQNLQMPLGAVGQTIEASEIGTRINKKISTSLSYEDIQTSYYAKKGDVSQEYLAKANREDTQLQDLWFWYDSEDFVALDLVNDPGGYVTVTTFSSPKANKSEIFTGDCTFAISGSHILFDTHISGTTLSFTAGGVGVSAQVTDSANGFVTAGFKVGDVVIITHLDGKDPLYAQVKTVAAGTMTFEDGVGNEATIPTATGISTTAIHAAEPFEVIADFT